MILPNICLFPSSNPELFPPGDPADPPPGISANSFPGHTSDSVYPRCLTKVDTSQYENSPFSAVQGSFTVNTFPVFPSRPSKDWFARLDGHLRKNARLTPVFL